MLAAQKAVGNSAQVSLNTEAAEEDDNSPVELEVPMMHAHASGYGSCGYSVVYECFKCRAALCRAVPRCAVPCRAAQCCAVTCRAAVFHVS